MKSEEQQNIADSWRIYNRYLRFESDPHFTYLTNYFVTICSSGLMIFMKIRALDAFDITDVTKIVVIFYINTIVPTNILLEYIRAVHCILNCVSVVKICYYAVLLVMVNTSVYMNIQWLQHCQPCHHLLRPLECIGSIRYSFHKSSNNFPNQRYLACLGLKRSTCVCHIHVTYLCYLPCFHKFLT